MSEQCVIRQGRFLVETKQTPKAPVTAIPCSGERMDSFDAASIRTVSFCSASSALDTSVPCIPSSVSLCDMRIGEPGRRLTVVMGPPAEVSTADESRGSDRTSCSSAATAPVMGAKKLYASRSGGQSRRVAGASASFSGTCASRILELHGDLLDEINRLVARNAELEQENLLLKAQLKPAQQ